VKVLPLLTQNSKPFVHTIKAVAQLKQPNILPVYEYGVEDDLAYITMRLVTGGTLAARRAQNLENKRSLPSLRETAIFFRQIAAALDYAHRHRVLHLDIKPSNIIFDSEGTAYLIDFGIARFKTGTLSTGEELSQADDRYALTASIATLLADPLPFDFNDPACTIGDHLDEFTEVLQTRYPKAADVLVPLFQRAFASDPADRFPTAQECSKAFNALRSTHAETTNFFSVYTTRPPLPGEIQALITPQAQDDLQPEPEPAVVSTAPDNPIPVQKYPIYNNPAFWLLLLVIFAFIAGMLLTRPQLRGGSDEADSGNNSSLPQSTPIPNAAMGESGITENSAWTPVERMVNNLPMVQVPDGCFMMGRERSNKDFEVPVHQVCLTSFWIGKTEVTNAQYRACVDAGACEPPSDRTYFDDPEYDNYPVVFVNWMQAKSFAEWAGGSLPTEAQWEYAARGPENWLYAWGNDHDGTRLNFCDASCARDPKDSEFDDGYPMFAPVGSFPDGKSWVGASDMTGNVWEWVADWYGIYSEAAQIDPTGPAEGDKRVLRGGSWTNTLEAVRTTYRTDAGPALQQSQAGFRIAMPAEAGS
jgi:serine/threonine-protein kinase